MHSESHSLNRHTPLHWAVLQIPHLRWRTHTVCSCTLIAVLIDALHAVHCAYVRIALSRALDGGGWKR